MILNTRFHIVLFVIQVSMRFVFYTYRLAMIAIAGFVEQELVEKKEIVYQVGLRGAADSVPPN